jgi:hypothetical protein
MAQRRTVVIKRDQIAQRFHQSRQRPRVALARWIFRRECVRETRL